MPRNRSPRDDAEPGRDDAPVPGAPSAPPSEAGLDGSRGSDSRLYVQGVVDSVAGASPAFQRAWEHLERRYRSHLLRYVERAMGPRARARVEPEDVVNEAWFRAYSARRSFRYRGPRSFFHWLRTQARRAILDHAKLVGDGGRTSAEPPRPEQAPTDRRSDPAYMAARREMEAEFEATLLAVPTLYREILRDRHLGGLSLRELAEKYGRIENTVTHQLRRGAEHWRKALAERFGPSDGEPDAGGLLDAR